LKGNVWHQNGTGNEKYPDWKGRLSFAHLTLYGKVNEKVSISL
jgi:hypothetical protein